ncbi:MAG: chemotaxis protein CheR [Bacteroidetes bacterium]|nr:MAG: chemotaxis protein CheR [Bacteroidota bacterium]
MDSSLEGGIFSMQGSYRAELGDAEFARLSTFIYSTAGIKMPPAKRIMLQSRLQKRLVELGMSDFKTYTDYVLSERGQQEELVHMLDVVSTNKTDFFREPIHFDFLRDQVLPEFYDGGGRTLKVWSAGCSSGEEPYTIAMVISEFLKGRGGGLDYSIIGTDLSTRILSAAVNAVYKEDRVEGVPLEIKRAYMLRSKDRTNPTVRMVPDIRRKIRFQRLNFMDASYNLNEMFDVVFCRNVLIYFDRATQEAVIRKQCAKLRKGGYFFLGHSESIMSMDLPLESIRPTIFRRI